MLEQFDNIKTMHQTTLKMIDDLNVIVEWGQEQGLKLTLRQAYYQFVQRGWIENTDRAYKRLGTALSTGRNYGLIDWDAFADRLRRVENPLRFDDVADGIDSLASWFKLDAWVGQKIHIEVWVEKDALSEVIANACRKYRVPWMVCRGFASQTALYEAGNRFANIVKRGQGVVVLHLGDHDPSGIDMSRDNAERTLKYMGGPETGIEPSMAEEVFLFRRIALTMEQVEELSPPPNPTKLSDSRAKKYIRQYGSESWELDALPPSYIKDLIHKHVGAILNHGKFEARLKKEVGLKADIRKLGRNYDAVKELVDSIADEEE